MDSMRVQFQRLLLNWKLNNAGSYLRALMHADGNIQYANYQSEAQMSDYLTSKGYADVITDITSEVLVSISHQVVSGRQTGEDLYIFGYLCIPWDYF